MLPYGRHTIDEDDIAAVIAALRSDWLTTGPRVAEFENAFARYVGAQHAVAVNSGTAALHCAMASIGVRPGDEVIVPTLTFAASANCVVYQGATPVFADVLPGSLLIDPRDAEAKIAKNTRAIIAVDYAGQPCDYSALQQIADTRHLHLVADACHSLGAACKGKPAGTLADLTVFSFHPVKHLTTGEGGMITTANAEHAQRMRRFRNHGISKDLQQRTKEGGWFYEMVDLGFNYRITDFQCALGMSQLRKLPRFVERRREIAHRYDAAFAGHGSIEPLVVSGDALHSYHLYVVRVKAGGSAREELFARLRARGVGANVHYVPVHLHPFYRQRFGTAPGMCPVAEEAYRQILSLPMFPDLSDADVDRVIDIINEETSGLRLAA